MILSYYIIWKHNITLPSTTARFGGIQTYQTTGDAERYERSKGGLHVCRLGSRTAPPYVMLKSLVLKRCAARRLNLSVHYAEAAGGRRATSID